MDEALTLDEILRANADLGRRIDALGISVFYDEEFDIFQIAIGEPVEAITEEIKDGLQMRLDPESLKIVGYEVLRFKHHFLKANPQFSHHFEALFEKTPMKRRDIPAKTKQRELAGKAIEQLVPALS